MRAQKRKETSKKGAAELKGPIDFELRIVFDAVRGFALADFPKVNDGAFRRFRQLKKSFSSSASDKRLTEKGGEEF